MGFLDKVKEGAAAATAVAKDSAQKGQAKLDASQAKKAANAMLHDLGAAAYAQQTGRGTPSTDADIERIIGALGQHEAEHGPIDLTLESPAGTGNVAPAGAAPAPPPTAESVAPPPAAAAPQPPPSGQTL